MMSVAAAVPPSAHRPPAGTSGGGAWRRWLTTAGPGTALLVVLALVGLTGNDAWTDEAVSVAATVQLAEVLDRTAGTMAAYYVVLDRWITVSASLWWLRFLSVLAAVAGLSVTVAVARRFRGARVALWTGLLSGGSFMVVRYAREMRSFAMVVLVVAAAWWVLDRIVAEPRGWRWPVAHAALAVLAPLTHGLALIPVLAQAPALALARAPGRVWLRVLPGLVGGIAVVGVLYELGASEVGSGRPLTVDNARELVLRLVGGFSWPPSSPLDPRWVLLGVTLYGMVLALHRTRRAGDVVGRFRAVAPAAWAFGTVVALLVLSVARPNLVDRYAIGSVPAFALLQADAALHVHARWLGSAGRGAPAWRRVPLVPGMVLALVLLAQVPLHRNYQTPWSDAVATLARAGHDGDALVVPRPSGRLMLDYAWSRHAGPLPDLAPLGPTHPLGRVQRYGSRATLGDMLAAADDYERVWVLRVEMNGEDPFYRAARYSPSLAWRFDPVAEYELQGGNRLVLLVHR